MKANFPQHYLLKDILYTKFRGVAEKIIRTIDTINIKSPIITEVLYQNFSIIVTTGI